MFCAGPPDRHSPLRAVLERGSTDVSDSKKLDSVTLCHQCEGSFEFSLDSWRRFSFAQIQFEVEHRKFWKSRTFQVLCLS